MLIAQSTLCDAMDYIAHQAPLSMEFSGQQYCSELPFPSPGDIPDPGTELQFPTLWADSLPSEPPEKPHDTPVCCALSLVALSCPTLCDPRDCSPAGSSVHGSSPGKNIGRCSHSLLQGIFLTEEMNPGFPHCGQILYHLSHLLVAKIIVIKWKYN